MKIRCSLCSLTVFLLFPILSDAYTWQFTSQPRQCSNVSISIEGSGGQPPYSLLILPTGPSPLPNNFEVRAIKNIPFPGTSTTLSFKLNYPENSSFTAVVSDKSGFGTGGASTPVTVLQSSDSSCYSSSNPVSHDWTFYFEPSGGLTQCQQTRLWWDSALVEGTVNFSGIIPGGTSFPIPSGSLSSTSNTGTGFNWTVNIAGDTTVLLVGNDDRGIGTGGVVTYTIADNANNSCLSNNSPSSTAGSPAGGSYPTSTSGSSNGSGSSPTGNSRSSSGSHSHIGAIIGGVIAALLLLAGLVGVWVLRRRSFAFSRQHPINVLQDVLHDDEERNEAHPYLPSQFVPEPYVVPDPTGTSSRETTTRETSEVSPSRDRFLSLSASMADIQTPPTPSTPRTPTRRKARESSSLPQLPHVNIIQHADAGPHPQNENLSRQVHPQTIELPPAYSHILRPQRPPFASFDSNRHQG